jgi:hypothetical protein
MSTADKAPATKKGALVISEVESVVEVSPVLPAVHRMRGAEGAPWVDKIAWQKAGHVM